jgi:hypothetical protein
LYAICAGPYAVIEDMIPVNGNEKSLIKDPMHTPQRVFVRKSLKEIVQHELVFGVTKTTIDFYQDNYG